MRASVKRRLLSSWLNADNAIPTTPEFEGNCGLGPAPDSVIPALAGLQENAVKRKYATGTARNRVGEGPPVVEATTYITPRAKGAAKQAAGGLWSKTATLEQTLAKIDRKTR